MTVTPERLAGIAAATLMLLAGGCGTSSTSDSATVDPRTSTETGTFGTADVGTGGELIPIDSDNVAMAGYDGQARVMTVLFDSARLYEYYNVPPTLWEAFVAAQPDPWSLVGYPQLVQGGFAYQEITP